MALVISYLLLLHFFFAFKFSSCEMWVEDADYFVLIYVCLALAAPVYIYVSLWFFRLWFRSRTLHVAFVLVLVFKQLKQQTQTVPELNSGQCEWDE
jgi:hypothetical protein